MPTRLKRIPHTVQLARTRVERRPDGSFAAQPMDLWAPKVAEEEFDWGTALSNVGSGIKNTVGGAVDNVAQHGTDFQKWNMPGFMQVDRNVQPDAGSAKDTDNLKESLGEAMTWSDALKAQWPTLSQADEWRMVQQYASGAPAHDGKTRTWAYGNAPHVAADEINQQFRSLPAAPQKYQGSLTAAQQAYIEAQKRAGYQYTPGQKGAPGTFTYAPPTFGGYSGALLSVNPADSPDRAAHTAAVSKAAEEYHKSLPWTTQLRGAGKEIDTITRDANNARAYADRLKAAGRADQAAPWYLRAHTLNTAAEEIAKTSDARLRKYRTPVMWGAGLLALGIPILGLMKKMFGGGQTQVVINNSQQQPAPYTTRGYNGPVYGGQ